MIFSMKQGLVVFFSIFFLHGCAAISAFKDAPEQVKELENLGTRQASTIEEKMIDKCLYHLFKRQQYHYEKFGLYLSNIKRLKTKDVCDESIQLSLQKNNKGYLAIAKIKTKDATVKWSLRDNGEVVEHDDFSFDLSF